MDRRHGHLRLVSGSSGAEKRLVERKAPVGEQGSDVPQQGRAVGEPPILLPVADPARAGRKQAGSRPGAAKGLDDVVYGAKRLHGRLGYSSGMNFVKPLEPELIQGLESGRIIGMRGPPQQRTPKSIGKRLSETRTALGLNQTDFSTRAGILKHTYNQWEKGHGRPSLDQAIKLCDTFDLTLDWIYFGDPSRLPHDLASQLLRPAS